jgi:hypothetical protein
MHGDQLTLEDLVEIQRLSLVIKEFFLFCETQSVFLVSIPRQLNELYTYGVIFYIVIYTRIRGAAYAAQ